MSDVTDTSIPLQTKPIAWWRSFSLTGPGALVAVGYIDPGNWATDLAGGSYAGYALLSIILVSSMIAIFLQIMSARLGIATGKDLALMSRETWPRLAWPAWIATELTIVATDLAEILGSAIALQLLFSIPLAVGVILTALDVLILLSFDKHGSRTLERIVMMFLCVIATGLLYELVLASPILGEVLRGFVPSSQIALDPKLLYLSIGVLGATIMPHNLYLHSHLVSKRWQGQDKNRSAQLATIDTIFSLGASMFLNAALVILAASVFHFAGRTNVAEIADAHRLLTPILGTQTAAIVFAIMLLAAGQSATITGTMAGQVVMSGFVELKMALWVRRLITRSMALVPALTIIIYCGEKSVTNMMLCSQVFLSLQLPFAILSLLFLTSSVQRMGSLVNSRWMHILGWLFALIILIANSVLVYEILH